MTTLNSDWLLYTTPHEPKSSWTVCGLTKLLTWANISHVHNHQDTVMYSYSPLYSGSFNEVLHSSILLNDSAFYLLLQQEGHFNNKFCQIKGSDQNLHVGWTVLEFPFMLGQSSIIFPSCTNKWHYHRIWPCTCISHVPLSTSYIRYARTTCYCTLSSGTFTIEIKHLAEALPSSEINRSNLVSVERVVESYSKLKNTNKAGTLINKVALEATFGKDVMRRCTPLGSWDLPTFSPKTYSPQASVEFEQLWSKCTRTYMYNRYKAVMEHYDHVLKSSYKNIIIKYISTTFSLANTNFNGQNRMLLWSKYIIALVYIFIG